MTQIKKAFSTAIAILALVVFLMTFAQKANAQTYYSRGGTYWGDGNSWSTSSHFGGSCGCVPTAGSTVRIGNGHTVYVRPDQADGIAGNLIINDDGNGGTLVIGSGSYNGTTTFTVSGDVTINNSGTIQFGNTQNANITFDIGGDIINNGTFVTGGNGSANNTMRISGNITNNGTFNFTTSNDNNTIVFDGSTNQTISGSQPLTLADVTMNTSGSNVLVETNIYVDDSFDFNSNGLMVIGATSDITLDNDVNITGANSNRYFQLDGTAGSNSQLIRENSGSDNDWEFLFPIGTSSGGYTPLDLTTANGANVTTSPDNGSTLAVKAVYNASVIGKMRRTFRLVVTGNNNGTNFTNADFYFNSGADVSAGDVLANYSTIWYLDAASGWTTVGGTAPGSTYFTGPSAGQPLSDGTYYYTIANSTAYPSIWYSYQNGVWNNPNVWTQDPSGTTWVNALSQYPSSGDEVVILNGFTVTNNLNNRALSRTTIQGGATLDMSTTTNNSLGIVEGAGVLRVNGVGLPLGNYTSFVSSLGGTIEYYNTAGDLPTYQTEYNNLKMTNSSGNTIFTLVSDMVVNGTFEISSSVDGGITTWQINDNSNNQRNVILRGNLLVAPNGRVTVGTGNENSSNQHNLAMYGNIINDGIIKFYDPTDSELNESDYGLTYPAAGVDLHRNELQGNAVTVTFSGNSNKTITCNNKTDFYRFIVNKGTGQQSILTVNSTNTGYFRLFGPSNIATVESGNSYDYVSRNALSIVNGTLELTGSINIPNICIGFSTTDYFPIPRNGALWLNGANVTVNISDNTPDVNNGNKDGRILISGLLRITAGTLNGGYSKGLGSQDGGSYLQEGGTVNCWQFRPRAVGTGIFAFTQSGGILNVGYGQGTGPNFSKIDQYEEGYSRFDLNSPNSTFQMSGDAVMNVAKPTNDNNSNGGLFKIASTAGNYNVTGGTINLYTGIERDNNSSYPGYINTTAPLYNVNLYEESNTTQNHQLQSNGLVVLNNLTLNNSGGGNGFAFVTNNLDVTIGGNFVIQSGTTYTPGTNTTTFSGTAAQAWTHDGTITSLNNVVVNKSAGVLTCGGSQTFPNITGLTLTSGTLNDGGKTLTVTSTLSNSATHAGTGSIVVNGPTVIDGNNGTFGNLTISTNNVVATTGKQSVTGDLRLVNGNTTLNIGSNNFTVMGNIYSNAATATSFTGSKRILTNGLRNDGGLTLRPASGVDLLFPVGTSGTTYTPATINVVASTLGLITIRPVANAHPNVTTTGQSVRYYWRVTSTGFGGISSVTHKSYTYAGATRDAASTNYRPARYDEVAYTWGYGLTYNATTGGGTTTIPNFNTGSGWIGLSADRLDGEYTAGNALAFQSVTVYYSRTNGNWGSGTTWSNVAVGGAVAGSTPCPTCPVVIGDGASNNHTVTINANNQGAGSLLLNSGSTLDCVSFTGLNFGVNTSGRGTLRISGTVFPSGDFLSFLGSTGGTVEWYGANKTIPSNGPAPMSLSLATYYNLTVSPTTGQSINLPANNLTIYNDFISNAAGTGQVRTNTGATRTLDIRNNLNVTSGSFIFRNGAVTNLSITNDLIVGNGAGAYVQTGGTRTHTFVSQGNIVNNGTILFRDGNEFVNLTFTGASNKSFTGTGTSTTLNQLTIDKGSSQTPTLTFDVTGTVNTLTNNWLTLVNGTMIFANANSYNLSTANTAYSIPTSAALKVNAGTVTILSAGNNNADLILAGKLEVSGGTVNVGNSGNNNNNDIEYAGAGSSTIVVSSGSLYVNGAIRRSTAILTGALVYTQTGGTVTVGGRNADNSRGVLEIENNAGSSFTLTGTSVLQILRSSGGSAFPDLYLNPVNSNVSSTSTIEMGANGLGNETMTMNVVPSLGNLTIMGSNGNAKTVNMQSSELTTSGTLTINQASTLNTNSIDVYIGGDLNINATGTYNGSNNTTAFNGSGAQSGSLSALSSFETITVNKGLSSTVSLSGTSPTIIDLNILNGILDVSSIGLTVNGNIVNNSSQIGTGSITISGTAVTHTITSSGGSFTNLTLGGSATTKTINVVGALTINGVLNFASADRYLYIGSSRLTVGQAGSISNAGNNRFIRTNGVSSDLGVTKNWALGSNTFNYPIGAMGNYTPVSFTLTVTNPGSITVAPVNSRHPSYGFLSTEQILNYYWIVRRDNAITYNNNGSHSYSYSTGLMGGGGGTRVAGFLDLSNPTGWVTSGHGGTASATLMTYTNLLDGNLPALGITYHFTVGTINTLPNPIATVYSRMSGVNVTNMAVGGNWSDPNSWTLSPTGVGAPLSSTPLGAPIVILSGTRINVDANSRSALTTHIEGMLDLGTTISHDLGTFSGTGTLRTSTNTFPAGDYTAFVSASGGTIEYVAPMTMNSRSTYNNISVVGTGNLIMTNTDLVLNGDLTINTGAMVNNTANNRNITIAGDWSNSGSFSAGTGSVTFNGSTAQTVTGTTTFSSLAVSKTGGNLILSGSGSTTVTGVLTLSNRHITTTASHLLSLGSAATLVGGSVNSFVSGPMRKTMAASSSFTYPVGSISASRYRPAGISATSFMDTWTVEYIPTNPSAGGFSNLLMNLLNLGSTSAYEYWNISRTGLTIADVTLSYGVGSYSGPDIGNVANLRVGHWDGLLWDLPLGLGTHTQSGTNVAGTVKVTNVLTFSPFTLSSTDSPSPLPVTWLSFTADRVDNYAVQLKWKTAQEENNDKFEIERSENGSDFVKIGTVKGAGNSSSVSAYAFVDNEASSWRRYYYRIRQVDYDGKADYSDIVVVIENAEARTKRWNIYPTPITKGQQLILENMDSEQTDEQISVIIYSAIGQVIFNQAGSLNELSESLADFSDRVGAGTYILKMTNGIDNEIFRLVRY